MKRTTSLLSLLTAASVLATAGVGIASADGRAPAGRNELKPNIVRVPTDVVKTSAVDVWTSAGEGGVLFPGETVNVSFRSRRDAYVTVVDIDTRGRATVLFPENVYDNGYVRGGETVSLPGRHARYQLQVTGPAGVERIVAFASDRPIGGAWRNLLARDAGYDPYDSGLGLGEVIRGRDTVWHASASATVGNVRIRAAGGTAPQVIRTPIVRVPDRDLRMVRSETWFEVAIPGRWYRR